jgi:hypothetical protein
MKSHKGSEGIAPPFFTSALRDAEWSALRTCGFIPGETAPNAHRTGDWVGPRAGMNVTKKRTISYPYRESSPAFSVVQPVA